MKNKFQKWTEEDSKFALKQRLMGKKFSTIANKLGRTEAAVRIRISSMKIEARAKTAALGPAVTKSYADKLVSKNRTKPKKRVAAKKAVVAPAESVLVNGGLMLTLSVSLAGGILGAAFYHYFL
jgi:predicted DNA binding CopG/RHH family protein